MSAVLRCLQVNYKNVMKQYGLGPNGGILTSLNLFATRFDQVRASPVQHSGCLSAQVGLETYSSSASPLLCSIVAQVKHGSLHINWNALHIAASLPMQVITLCEKKRDPPLKYVIVDTPGQIEIFTWSASGAIITEAFASTFPTMVAFVIDTPRCAHPQTFMSNMLQV